VILLGSHAAYQLIDLEITMCSERWLSWALAGMLSASSSLRADDFRPLFNGKDLTGWVVDGPAVYKDKDGQVLPMWAVRDGVLTCAGRKFGFLRYKEGQFSDFILHVEYRMSPDANSGIGIRTGPFDPHRSKETRPSYACYEVQLLDDAGKPPTKYSSGSLYRYVAPKLNPVNPAGEWNTVEVECRGPRIRVTINGNHVLDVDQSTMDEIKNKPLKGFVCLQSHTKKVEFRNVGIRELGTPAAK
jgi:hypothetical protein